MLEHDPCAQVLRVSYIVYIAGISQDWDVAQLLIFEFEYVPTAVQFLPRNGRRHVQHPLLGFDGVVHQRILVVLVWRDGDVFGVVLLLFKAQHVLS